MAFNRGKNFANFRLLSVPKSSAGGVQRILHTAALAAFTKRHSALDFMQSRGRTLRYHGRRRRNAAIARNTRAIRYDWRDLLRAPFHARPSTPSSASSAGRNKREDLCDHSRGLSVRFFPFRERIPYSPLAADMPKVQQGDNSRQLKSR